MEIITEIQFEQAVSQTKLGVKSIKAARAVMVNGLSLKGAALKCGLTREEVRAYAAKIRRHLN